MWKQVYRFTHCTGDMETWDEVIAAVLRCRKAGYLGNFHVKTAMIWTA